jgi:hypothetical protein
VVLHGGPEEPDELARDGDDGHLRLLAVGEHRRGVHRDAAEALHAADGFARRGAGRELLGLGVRLVAGRGRRAGREHGGGDGLLVLVAPDEDRGGIGGARGRGRSGAGHDTGRSSARPATARAW